MSDQFQAINEAVSIISNLLRKLEGTEITIACLREMVKDRDNTIESRNQEIETMKKKEDKK